MSPLAGVLGMKKIDVNEPRLVTVFWFGELAYASVIVLVFVAI